ncbi:MAG: precorrin-6y C5,15-methyltransferase (decarboxylating) subunit CbiE [Deltaproteobacteria bacterium]|nr:precorrin-6y C5,15-methyltransferase (decarboxylating) subunit CbiE [Deltaproteobacteria bacterium]
MIYIIGIGVEGKSSLSQRALKLIQGAGMLAGGRRHLASFPGYTGERVVIGSNLDAIIKAICKESEVRSQKSGENIVVLATGDPSFFGIADFLIKRLGKDAVEIIPNVNTMQYAFAKIKENWNNARFLSVHGRNKSQKSKVKSQKFDEGTVNEITKYDKAGIFTDPENTPAKIAKAMMDKGVEDYRVYVCEDLGTDKEKITEGTLAQIARKRFSPLNVMVLIRQEVRGGGAGKTNAHFVSHIPHPTSHIPFGIPDFSFSHSNGMITKEEIRVISLSKLKLKQDSVVWDIGAGSGSLSIEAAMFANYGKVFAVEKDAGRIKHIEENKKKFNAVNLEIIRANAPDSLKSLPAPDAVFIGGGGKDIAQILDVCSKRIRRGGRIVVNAITLETLATAANFFQKKKWDVETISVNIAKTKDIAAGEYGHTPLHIFNAHNPVFIVVGERP